MLFFYSQLLRLLVPLMLLRLLWRSHANSAYRAGLWQRLALGLPADQKISEQGRIWLHAVSVGETLAMAPLIEQLLHRYPARRLLVTSTTPTGAEQVARLFGDRVDWSWMPIDTPGAVDRFLNYWQPAVVLLAETEIWPNVIVRSRARELPVLLLNARLSRRSAQGYRRLAWLSLPVLGQLTAVACQHIADARRFRALGVSDSALSVAGSIKFDIDRTAFEARAKSLGAMLAIDTGRKVVIAASTHAGEDKQVLGAFARLLTQCPEALLILAPRHPERMAAVKSLVDARQWHWQKRSSGTAVSATTQVLLLDTLGELGPMLSLADVVFVGGSLVPHGGHNPLEALVWAKPVITGPAVFNFAAIYRDLLRCGGAEMVADEQALGLRLLALMADDSARHFTGGAGLRYLDAKRGALDNQCALIARYLS